MNIDLKIIEIIEMFYNFLPLFLVGCLGQWFNLYFDFCKKIGPINSFRQFIQPKFYIFNTIIFGGIVAALLADSTKYAFIIGFAGRTFQQHLLKPDKEEEKENKASSDASKIVDDIEDKSEKQIKEGMENLDKELSEIENDNEVNNKGESKHDN